MDFVDGLGDTTHTLEIAVDDIGRLELRHGRVRMVLVTQRDSGLWIPAVSIVWSIEAWKAARSHYETCHKIIYGGMPDQSAVAPLFGAQHH